VSCPVCASGAVRRKLRIRDVDVQQCRACGLAWWEPPRGDFAPEALYDAGYFEDPAALRGYDDYAGLEPALRHGFARRIARLGPPPRPGARLLDVGAAFGFAVAEARRAGWRACGIEIGEAAARRARAAASGCVARAHALRAPFPDACFDAITLWDVLEHLRDPHAAMAELARLLAPGGILALSTGDVGSLLARVSGARWHLYTLPEHLFFFSRPSLRRLVEAHGLSLRSLRAEGSFYSASYLIERLRKTLLRRSAPARAFRIGRGWRIPVNLFDVVTLHAVKRSAP
jgi:SAM-dependent methyltransferase